jgi:hypothetical protein
MQASTIKTWASDSPTLVTPTLSGDLDADGANIDNGGVIFLKEQAEADGDVAGSGQIWVDTATPNVLMFTDDAGTDFTLSGGLFNVSEDTTPTLGGPLDADGNDIENGGVVFLTEQAEAEADVAGKGQIWVDTATPNLLKFTDDAGTDGGVIMDHGVVPFTGLLRRSVTAGITAHVGSSQGDGPLTTDINQISTCANAGDAVTLPTAAAGLTVTIINNGAEACDVFPATDDDLGAGANTAASLAAAANITYVAYDATNWVAVT